MKTLASILILTCCMSFQTPQEMKSIIKNKMTVKWQVHKNHIHIEAKAPTKGWVAVGFNEKSVLTGTNLIMGCVQNDKVKIDDGFIIGPGDHQSIVVLGGKHALRNTMGSEDNSTIISFDLPLKSPDEFHQNLVAGKTYHLLMAYSLEDDFDHHSIMRTSVEIIL